MPSSRGSSLLRDQTRVSCISLHWQAASFTTSTTQEAPSPLSNFSTVHHLPKETLYSLAVTAPSTSSQPLATSDLLSVSTYLLFLNNIHKYNHTVCDFKKKRIIYLAALSLSCSTWDLCYQARDLHYGMSIPEQLLNTGPLYWEHRVLTARPPGKSPECDTLCLASFTQHVFKVHPCCSMYQSFFLFYGQIILHCMARPQIVHPSNS